MTTPHPKGDFDLSRAVWQSAGPGEGGDGSSVEVAFVDD